jgi:CPA2 family monovalent cation:H+ antiporter-2
MTSTAHDPSALFIELGAALVGLAILARIASRLGFPAIPFYLLAGLAFGNGGIAPLQVSESFIQTGAEIGILLLLFMLGLEYTGDELKQNLRAGLPAGVADFLLNFTPGLTAGFLLRWSLPAAIVLGGVTYISSSGIAAKVLSDLKRLDCAETGTILSILVLEDLAMAAYLPLVTVLLSGGGLKGMATSMLIAVGAAGLALLVALRYGDRISHLIAHQSEEVVLLSIFGVVLLVAGFAQRLQVSPAIAAFLTGIMVSGPIAKQSRRLIAPLRDLFAATFFFFFGLQIHPSALVSALAPGVALGVVTGLTKVATGYWAAARKGADRQAGLRAGVELIARGEFSIVIAGLGVAAEPQLAPLSSAYVLFLAVTGPILARAVK